MTDYIELHARSAFSFLEGAALPEELVDACAAAGMPAMALLDRDGVYGAPRFHLAAKKAGVRAHIGSEISVGNCFSPRRHPTALRAGSGTEKNHKSQITNHKSDSVRLPLLVASPAGYQNLCRLITRMKLRVPKHEECGATREELAEHAGGLICLTGGEHGPLAAALDVGGLEAGRECLLQLEEIFGRGNVYVEMQRHFDRKEAARNQAAAQLARELGLPLLATNGVEYSTAAQRPLLDVFTAIRNHRTLSSAGRLLAHNSERHLKTPQEMTRLFADLPDAIAHTGELSARLEFTLDNLGYQFPRYPVPAGETMMSFLRKRTEEGARTRYRPYSGRARWQIERELALIEKLDLAGYFLIVWDLICFCRRQGILVQGRGSAANSAVCYSLGITAVDPIALDLLFERFLSEERGEWPDIDLDLPSGEQRDRVIQYVYQRYGERGAAMTANVITYRGRSAAREVGKVLGFDAETVGRLSRLAGTWEFRDPADTAERRFRDAGLDLRHPRIRKFFELYRAVQDRPRHLGQHSGGMVICQGQLDSVVPLEPAAMPGRVVVQWDKEDCADLGIIKVDLLGLGMMAALEESLQLIREHYGEEVDLAHLPPDDPEVYAALDEADTIGMFQIESRAQMSSLPRLRPRKFYDLVVQVAIIRPGPIVGRMVHPYIRRRQGREPVVYPHASLEPVLARTLGVPLFQEQLMRMVMIAAGFTGGEAEELRRALVFKRSQARMKEIETKLRRGMERNGIPAEPQEQIVQSISSFALYGFPESHAASFALLTYASAWLKCRYLAAFTAAMLNHQPMGFYHPATLVMDAQRHGLKVRPVDVTRSNWKCTLEPDRAIESSGHRAIEGSKQTPNGSMTRSPDGPIFSLRLGLSYVKGLRQEAGEALLRARAAAPFRSIDDLARRVPELRKDELEALAEIGALNRVASSEERGASALSVLSSQFSENEKRDTRNQKPLHRRDALWQVARAIRPKGPLLESNPDTSDSPLATHHSPLAPMSPEERLVADFRGMGLTVGPHPMTYGRARLNQLGVRRACELRDLPGGKNVKVAGCVIARQRPGTARGFVFLSLEDETGIANAIVTPDVFDQNRWLLSSAPFLLVEGRLQNQDRVISVKAERIQALDVTRAETRSHDFH